MKTRVRIAARIAAFAALAVTTATARGIVQGPIEARAGEVVVGWVVDRADNICGIDDAKMLSKPAKVDYDALLKATPEMKKIKDDKIDPNSPQGIQLLWPFDGRWFISGWDVFLGSERRQLFSAPTMRRNGEAIAGEVALLGPIVAVLWLVRVKALAGLSSQLSRRDHPAK